MHQPLPPSNPVKQHGHTTRGLEDGTPVRTHHFSDRRGPDVAGDAGATDLPGAGEVIALVRKFGFRIQSLSVVGVRQIVTRERPAGL
jgi:hypothetical protein